MLIAKKDRVGEAIRDHNAYGKNIGKVAVKWRGRKTKIYWHSLDELEFIGEPVDLFAYVAQPTSSPLNCSPLPAPPAPNEFHFGDNLRTFRRDHGLRQWELAELMTKAGVKVAQTTISNWERRCDAPDGSYVKALAVALRVPALIFFVNYRDCTWMDRTIEYLTKVRAIMCPEGFV